MKIKAATVGRECCSLRQEVSVLEVKEKGSSLFCVSAFCQQLHGKFLGLDKYSAESLSKITLLEARVPSKEKELKSLAAVCAMQKDKISRQYFLFNNKINDTIIGNIDVNILIISTGNLIMSDHWIFAVLAQL